MKQSKATTSVAHFFKDDQGRWVVAQFPNALLIIWLVLLLVNFLLQNQRVGYLQSAVLFAWAYLELTQGASPFRRVLGAVVMIFAVASFFW